MATASDLARANTSAAFALPLRRDGDAGGSAPKRSVDAASRQCVAANPCLDIPASGSAGAGGYTKRGILTAGLSLAATPAFAGIHSHAAKKSPDAELLTLCVKLTQMQAEWQRLWHFTSEDWGLDDPPATAADCEWLAYNDHVWPAIHISGQTPHHPDDLPGKLLDFRSVTVEGMRAKKAAVLAMDDAACYGADARNDACEMYQSVLVDAAGPSRMLMGEDAPKPSAPALLAAAPPFAWQGYPIRPSHPRRVGHPDQDGREGGRSPNPA